MVYRVLQQGESSSAPSPCHRQTHKAVRAACCLQLQLQGMCLQPSSLSPPQAAPHLPVLLYMHPASSLAGVPSPSLVLVPKHRNKLKDTPPLPSPSPVLQLRVHFPDNNIHQVSPRADKTAKEHLSLRSPPLLIPPPFVLTRHSISPGHIWHCPTPQSPLPSQQCCSMELAGSRS